MRDRKTEVTIEQIERIRQLSREGYSANQIQRKLQQEHIGSRRTTLSERARESKRQPVQHSVESYIPRRRARIEGLRGKQVTLIGRHRGKRAVKQVRGSGRQLYRWIVDEMESDFWDAKPTVVS